MDFSKIVETIIIYAVPLAMAVSVHESAHGWMAERYGDPTARDMGRITLNPIPHIDPVGTVILPIVLAVSGMPVFGWAKPVPVNVLNFRKLREGNLWTSLAGPGSNLLMAIGSAIILRIIMTLNPDLFYSIGLSPAELRAEGVATAVMVPIIMMLEAFMNINVLLMLFNMIPILPLDGGHVAYTLLPDSLAEKFEGLAVYGTVIVVALVMVVPFTSDAFYNLYFAVDDLFYIVAGG